MVSVHIPKALPKLPSDWSGDAGFVFHGSLSAPVHRSIEPVGPHFLAHARRVGSCLPSKLLFIEVDEKIILIIHNRNAILALLVKMIGFRHSRM